MINITMDDQNGPMFVEQIVAFIKENPIILHNIVEPCVNEIISDANVPDSVKTHINTVTASYFLTNPLESVLDEAAKECINDVFTENYGSDYIDRIASDWCERQDFDRTVGEGIQEKIDELDINDIASDIISGEISHYLEGRESDIEESVTEWTREIVVEACQRDIDIESITERICESNFEEAFNQIFSDTIRERVIELLNTGRFEEATLQIVRDEVRRVSSHEVQEAVTQINSMPRDDWKQVTIRCAPESYTIFIGMIQTVLKETVEITHIGEKENDDRDNRNDSSPSTG
jgi:hypothetical protein